MTGPYENRTVNAAFSEVGKMILAFSWGSKNDFSGNQRTLDSKRSILRRRENDFGVFARKGKGFKKCKMRTGATATLETQRHYGTRLKDVFVDVRFSTLFY